MRNFSILFTLFLLFACGSSQKTTSQLQSGNYEAAFNTAIAALNKDKTKKSSQKNIPLLKEAYDKAAVQNLAEIDFLKKTKSADNLKKIYGNYLNLDLRQDEVKLLLPLSFEGNPINFDFNDYTSKIVSSKKTYSDYLYTQANKKLKGNITDAREAYKLIEDLIYVDPTYKPGLDNLMTKAKNRGSSFVFVSLNNKTGIRRDSITHFTQINSANFPNPWVIFHNKKERNVNYTHEVAITFDKLTYDSPVVQPQTIRQEARIQDGWEYQKDAKGNVMKDEKGNDIKIAKYRNVLAEVVLYQQIKNAKLDGTVSIVQKNAPLNTKAEFGEAKFKNEFGKFRGDQRAIEQKYHAALQAKEVPYPADYLFVKFAVNNFKQKVEAMLSQQNFQ